MAGQPTFTRLVQHGRDFFRRHWRRALVIRERLRLSEETFHLVMAAVIGIVGALTSLVYHEISQLAQWLFLILYRPADGEMQEGVVNEIAKWLFLERAGDLNEIARMLVPWQRVLIPTLGGLGAGLVLYLGLRLIGNPGLSNLLEVVVAGDGRLRLRPALLNAFASLLSINTGASIGREGLIIQLSAAFASKLGQIARWPPYRLRLMVACGAAAGIAAGCNAPIAGAVFAAQIVLGNFSMNLFAPLVVSSVIAAVLPRPIVGTAHWFVVPEFDFTRLTQLPWFLPLGALAGAAGAGFQVALGWSEKLFSRMPAPLYARVGMAGLAVGLIALAYPEVWGNGYGPTNQLLAGEAVGIKFLVGLFAAKLLATVLTVGSGTVGGVFTPTLFLGAALGSFFGALLHLAGWATTLPTRCFALVGMGSMLAATTHSPLLAIIMLFELSLNYSQMPPVMLGCVVATLVARRLHPESIYTEPLRRKGLELHRESPHLGAATEKTVADLMRQPVPPVRETAAFREIADRFLVSTNNFLPVVDGIGKLIGVVALHDLKEYLSAGQELNGVIALDVMRPPPPCLTPDQRLSDVLPVLLASELRNVPVVNNAAQFRLVGAVARAEALGLLSEAITARSISRL